MLKKMNMDPILALQEMLEECHKELDNVKKAKSAVNYDQFYVDIAYDNYWGADHTFIGALGFAFRIGCIDYNQWQNYWSEIDQIHQNLLEQ